MNNTNIAWTENTWNPVSGCQKISEGCRYCYASVLAENKRGTRAFPDGFDITIREHKLQEPIRQKTPTLIFVGSMTDLFWDAIPEAYIHRVVDVIEQTPQHQYQVLTKRPNRLLVFAKSRKLPNNCIVGVTVESADYISRVDTLNQVDAKRFISVEPLLGPMADALAPVLQGVSWVIVGGESGTHLADPKICAAHGLVEKTPQGWGVKKTALKWVRDIRDLCGEKKTPFFFKQWGGLRPKSNGSLLDGEEHHYFPSRTAP